MNTNEAITQSEVESAWTLWQALEEHMAILWDRYEEPFTKRIRRELEEEQTPCQDDFTDDDIPF